MSYIRHRALVAQLECSKARKGPLDPWYCSIRDPEGILKGQDPSRPAWLEKVIFHYFLLLFRCPNFSDFDAILAPTCLPTWTQNPPKSVPRGLQIPSQLASCFECLFLSILGSSWIDFWWVLGLKLGAKLTKKSIIWPLVGKLAEITKNTKFANDTLWKVFWTLSRPTSKQN